MTPGAARHLAEAKARADRRSALARHQATGHRADQPIARLLAGFEPARPLPGLAGLGGAANLAHQQLIGAHRALTNRPLQLGQLDEPRARTARVRAKETPATRMTNPLSPHIAARLEYGIGDRVRSARRYPTRGVTD